MRARLVSGSEEGKRQQQFSARVRPAQEEMRREEKEGATLGLGLGQLREEGEGGRRRAGRREELGQQAEKEGGRERIRFSFFFFFQIHFQKVFKTF
jgi:hypothetical protein